ncbi:fluoride efflux transporter FluC [Streptomyces uncialis]|uniref:fluoride efflux transporter FluC n=1 Tax=Streptomyces uncialis TaxID=1048205 RepID=UPI0038147447
MTEPPVPPPGEPPAPTQVNPREPVDPDVPGGAGWAPDGRWPVLGAVAAGGALGASARYGAVLLWPTAEEAFPWTTLGVNAVGCALIGVLMAALAAARAPHTLLRPFLATGVLGGFTTFSAYALDVRQLVHHGRPGPAVWALVLTPVVALAAVWAAARITRRTLRRRVG